MPKIRTTRLTLERTALNGVISKQLVTAVYRGTHLISWHEVPERDDMADLVKLA